MIAKQTLLEILLQWKILFKPSKIQSSMISTKRLPFLVFVVRGKRENRIPSSALFTELDLWCWNEMWYSFHSHQLPAMSLWSLSWIIVLYLEGSIRFLARMNLSLPCSRFYRNLCCQHRRRGGGLDPRTVSRHNAPCEELDIKAPNLGTILFPVRTRLRHQISWWCHLLWE